MCLGYNLSNNRQLLETFSIVMAIFAITMGLAFISMRLMLESSQFISFVVLLIRDQILTLLGTLPCLPFLSLFALLFLHLASG